MSSETSNLRDMKVSQKQDGVWISIVASTGLQAAYNVDAKASMPGASIMDRALRDWAHDQLKTAQKSERKAIEPFEFKSGEKKKDDQKGKEKR